MQEQSTKHPQLAFDNELPLHVSAYAQYVKFLLDLSFLKDEKHYNRNFRSVVKY